MLFLEAADGREDKDQSGQNGHWQATVLSQGRAPSDGRPCWCPTPWPWGPSGRFVCALGSWHPALTSHLGFAPGGQSSGYRKGAILHTCTGNGPGLEITHPQSSHGRWLRGTGVGKPSSPCWAMPAAVTLQSCLAGEARPGLCGPCVSPSLLVHFLSCFPSGPACCLLAEPLAHKSLSQGRLLGHWM